jgi:hypothetical protein
VLPPLAIYSLLPYLALSLVRRVLWSSAVGAVGCMVVCVMPERRRRDWLPTFRNGV